MSHLPGTGRLAEESGHQTGVDELIAKARALIIPGARRILGLTGAPGAGKSTIAEVLAAALGDSAVLISLDGFHLADTELHRIGLHARKGAPETFDAPGFVNLLQRLRNPRDEVVYAPLFDRSLEASLAGAVAIPRQTPLVLVEGNYLLLDDAPWREVRRLLDECWYIDPGEDTRLQRLIARHEAFGRSAEEARDRSLGTDQRNAELIAASRQSATSVIRVPALQVEPRPVAGVAETNPAQLTSHPPIVPTKEK